MYRKFIFIFVILLSINGDLFSQEGLVFEKEDIFDFDHVEIGGCVGPNCNDGRSSVAYRQMRMLQRLKEQAQKMSPEEAASLRAESEEKMLLLLHESRYQE